MDNTITSFDVNLDTPLCLLSPRQLFSLYDEWQKQKIIPTVTKGQDTKKWYVNSIKDWAKILGSSRSTVYRMKSEGLLNDAISQYGRWMLIDVELVIEKFKLSNRGRKRKIFK